MIRTKDFLLLLIVTFMSIVFLQPDSSIMIGLDRTFLFAGLLIVVTIALAHYSKVVLVTAVLIVAIGANLPREVAGALNVDARYFMIGLVIVLLVAVANRVIKLPTGLDKHQGFPAGQDSVNPNPNLVELNLPVYNDPELNESEDNDPELNASEDNDPVPDPAVEIGKG
jgi:hypothetical protein